MLLHATEYQPSWSVHQDHLTDPMTREVIDSYFLPADYKCTVTYTESGTPMLSWDSPYLCHFSTEMAEIWSPGTSFKRCLNKQNFSALSLVLSKL